MRAKYVFWFLVFVCIIPELAVAQGVYSGSKDHPMPMIWGRVAKIIDPGPPMKLEFTQIKVKLVKVHYEGIVQANGLAKPTEGEVREVYIGDEKVTLDNTDISKGFLTTKDYGIIMIFFTSSMMSDSCTLAVSEKQLSKIQNKLKSSAGE